MWAGEVLEPLSFPLQTAMGLHSVSATKSSRLIGPCALKGRSHVDRACSTPEPRIPSLCDAAASSQYMSAATFAFSQRRKDGVGKRVGSDDLNNSR